MIKNHWNRFLRAEATEHESAGGGAAAAAVENPGAEAQAGEQGAKEEDAKPPAAGPTLLQRVKASMKDKPELMAERDEAVARAVRAEGELVTVAAKLVAAEAQVRAKQTELDAIAAALNATEAKQATVDESAARMVAQAGFAQEDLPAATAEGDTVEAMQARLKDEKDPVKQYALAEAINAKAYGFPAGKGAV